MNKNKPNSSYEASTATKVLFLSANWIQLCSGIVSSVLIPIFVFSFGVASRVFVDIVHSLVSLYVIMAVGVSRLLYYLNQRKSHKIRNKFASSVIADLNSDSTQSFCLYLRPFLTSRSLRVPNSRYNLRFLPSMDKFYGRRTDLETMFSISLERQKHPLVAIGETGFTLGAGKVTVSDDDWQNVFKRLAYQASIIIMVPLPRPSTLWELDYIFSHASMLEKTLFVMPMRLRSLVPERLEGYWEEMRTRMDDRGIKFPVLNSMGGFFIFQDRHATMHTIDSGGFDDNYVSQIVTGFVNRLRAEEIFKTLPLNLQDALPKLFEAMLYCQPETHELRVRPIPLHTLGRYSYTKELAQRFTISGLTAVHRQRDGFQAWYEVILHPGILNWPRLKAWAADNIELLQIKGKIVQSTHRAETNRQQVFDAIAKPILCVSSEIQSMATIEKTFNLKAPSPLQFPPETLRPEEFIFLQRK
jgi:hypothetical protein